MFSVLINRSGFNRNLNEMNEEVVRHLGYK
jgi:hypothetical protein